MGLFKHNPELEEPVPFTIVLTAETEDDLERLRIILARATQMLALAEPENADAAVVYAAFRSYLPTPTLQFAPNVVYVAPERWRERR